MKIQIVIAVEIDKEYYEWLQEKKKKGEHLFADERILAKGIPIEDVIKKAKQEGVKDNG